ncbi:MAG TPA: TIM-barrel domain-containing protein [Fimbriimonadaceae bacterium]|nr:TIM-barrel domain-containing protein [Fimbriimonadaceae bacterium]
MICVPFLVAAASPKVETIPHGLIAHTAKGLVRLEACTERTIRVSATPNSSFSNRPSLSVIHRWGKAPAVKVEATSREAVLKTKALAVRVDLKTGAILYLDAKGGTLLDQPSFPAFAKRTILDDPAYSALQSFTMPKGEAYYGLGNHQNGTLNLRGQSMDLVQQNMEEMTPFLLSSKGYGLLWDSASGMHIDFGSKAGPIPSAQMLDEDGKPGGLTGHYFKGVGFDEHVADRKDPQIDFDWSKTPPPGLGLMNYSVRWSGFIETGAAGDTTFTTTGDDGIRLWVDGKKLVDDWADHPPTTDSGTIRLEAHKRYPIRMEYYQRGGGAVVSLGWRTPSEHPMLDWSAEFVDQTDTYFVYGPDFDDVIRQYRNATGAAPLYGKWAYGFWQCKERYRSQQELLDIAHGFRERNIPIDNIVQDWFYWDPHPWGSHQFDEKRYPDMKAAVDQLHQDHFHLMISVWAKFAPGSANYDELDKAGGLYPLLGDDRYYDPFNPKARAIYWRQIKDELLTNGIDAWWLDASEPELDMEGYRSTMTGLGVGARVLNAFPLMHTQGVYQGQRKAEPNKRVFILTRSVFAGQQRNAATTWSGDIQGNWATFAREIPCGLNFCMAGVPYWCTDTGGFFSHPATDPNYRELFVRWFQFSTFNPIFRVHGTGADKEPWRFGPEAEAILTKYDRLRYRLLPYLYSQAWQVTHDGGTILRGLPMDFRTDPKVLDISDQFMFGPAFLVCPVIQPHAAERTCYLPKAANWVDFWAGERLAGGRDPGIDAPLDRMPLFVRAGSIVPMGPDEQYATEKPDDPIELRIYPGANGHFRLYEDAGEGYGYEKGQYATIPLSWNDADGTLTIGKRQGSFPGMLKQRTFRVVVVRPGHGVGVDATGKPDLVVSYRGVATVYRGIATRIRLKGAAKSSFGGSLSTQ